MTTKTETGTTARSAAENASGEPPPERVADEIEELTADGKPAHPEMRPRHIALLLVGLAVVVLLAGIVVGILRDPLTGFLIGGLGLVLFIVNPGLWASVSRAGDRARAKEHLEQQPGADARRRRERS